MNTIINIVELLNRNQGALMLLLTFIYVIATLVIVKYTRKSNELARQALIQSMEFEKQRNRPYVIFDLLLKERVFYAVVKNTGKQSAYDIKITTEPEIIRDVESAKKISFIEKGITFLAPNGEIDDFIDVSPSFLKKHPATTFSVEVSYKDCNGELYQEKSNISTAFQNRMSITRSDSPVENIERHLRDIANDIRVIASRK